MSLEDLVIKECHKDVEACEGDIWKALVANKRALILRGMQMSHGYARSGDAYAPITIEREDEPEPLDV